MHEVTPSVRLVGATAPAMGEIGKYLESIGAERAASHYLDEDTRHALRPELGATDAEDLLSFAGKLCYKSFEAGLNPNVTKARENMDTYLADAILKTGHGSVLEHASASFLFADVSRVFTHELVRHRVGSSFSQESLRYVRLTDLGFWMPEELKGNAEGEALIGHAVAYLEGVQERLAEIYGIDEPGLDFAKKKRLTSAFRRVAPIGLATNILWTANFRTLRHVIALRTSPAAEEEMRLVFDQVATICKKEWPRAFADMLYDGPEDGPGAWRFTNPQQPYEKNSL